MLPSPDELRLRTPVNPVQNIPNVAFSGHVDITMLESVGKDKYANPEYILEIIEFQLLNTNRRSIYCAAKSTQNPNFDNPPPPVSDRAIIITHILEDIWYSFCYKFDNDISFGNLSQ